MKKPVRGLALSFVISSAIAIGFGSPPPARAAFSKTICLVEYASCLVSNRSEPDPVRHIAMDMDCSVDVVACMRRAIFS